jgi:hypothetical protein
MYRKFFSTRAITETMQRRSPSTERKEAKNEANAGFVFSDTCNKKSALVAYLCSHAHAPYANYMQ